MIWPVKSSDQPKDGGFATSRRTDQNDELPVGNVERNVVDSRRVAPGGVYFGNVFKPYSRHISLPRRSHE